jgi:methylated-DNA-protein-cysteine methyltransferase-like protein
MTAVRRRRAGDPPRTGWQVFVDRVHAIARVVPRGHVVTYGQLARLAGRPHAAREVGWIAHAGGKGIPWQRVVNRFGGLASGYGGGPASQGAALRRDGVAVQANFRVDLSVYQWWPVLATAKRIGLAADAIAAIGTALRSSSSRARRSR